MIRIWEVRGSLGGRDRRGEHIPDPLSHSWQPDRRSRREQREALHVFVKFPHPQSR